MSEKWEICSLQVQDNKRQICNSNYVIIFYQRRISHPKMACRDKHISKCILCGQRKKAEQSTMLYVLLESSLTASLANYNYKAWKL